MHFPLPFGNFYNSCASRAPSCPLVSFPILHIYEKKPDSVRIRLFFHNCPKFNPYGFSPSNCRKSFQTCAYCHPCGKCGFTQSKVSDKPPCADFSLQSKPYIESIPGMLRLYVKRCAPLLNAQNRAYQNQTLVFLPLRFYFTLRANHSKPSLYLLPTSVSTAVTTLCAFIYSTISSNRVNANPT